MLATTLYRRGKSEDAASILSGLWANDASRACATGADLDSGLMSVAKAVDFIFDFCKTTKIWKDDKYAAVRFLLKANRKQEAKRASSHLKPSSPRNLASFASDIDIRLLVESKTELLSTVKSFIRPVEIRNLKSLSERCGLSYQSNEKIYVPSEVRLDVDQAGQLSVISYEIRKNEAIDNAEGSLLLEKLDSELSSYIRACFSVPLSMSADDTAERARARMMLAPSQELAEIVHQRMMQLGYDLDAAGKYADAADTFMMSAASELLSHESIRNGLLKARNALQKVDPIPRRRGSTIRRIRSKGEGRGRLGEIIVSGA
jgi:hypothetical protein